MFNQQSHNIPNVSQLQPAIICTADLSYYLIGAEDENGKFYNVYSHDVSEPLFAPSLEQAKRVLKAILVRQAYKQSDVHCDSQKVIIELNNPYDEMIGTQTYGPTRMVVKLIIGDHKNKVG